MDLKIKNICIPLNFSESATNALRIALRISVTNKAQLHVIHIVKPMAKEHFANVRKNTIAMLKNLLKRTVTSMHVDAEEKMELVTLIANFELRMGELGKAIPEFEHEMEIDLTILGTNSNKGISKMITANSAIEILKYSSCPVLTIPGEFDKTQIESVLFPITNGFNVNDKIDWLVPIIAKGSMKIHLLTVFDVNKEDLIYEQLNNLKEIRNTIHYDQAKITLEAYASKSFPQAITEVAAKMHSDLIIINIEAYKKWYDLFFGEDFSFRMIINSVLPILCFNPNINSSHGELQSVSQKYN
jgi:nucleotide-binding universal stress UspA family protein